MYLYGINGGKESKTRKGSNIALSLTAKKQWREMCQSDPNIHIFMRDWWLDAVCGEDNWDCIIEYFEDSYRRGVLRASVL